MTDYEVVVETIVPCGGDNHSKQEIIEVEAESPEAYVKANGRWPISDVIENPDGTTLIITGDGKGYFVKYTFTK